MKLLILALLLPLSLAAQEKPPSEKQEKDKTTWDKVKESSSDALDKTKDVLEKGYDKSKDVLKSTGEVLASAKDFRAERHWIITGNYSYLDMMVPGKYGLTVGYVKDPANTYELDYMRGSFGLGWLGVDIGTIKEQRLSLLWRSYNKRNTFNYQMGLNYNIFDVHLGSKLINKLVGANYDYSVMNIETLGISWGLGHRWQTKGGFVWAFDWLQVHMPIVVLRQDTPFIDATPDNNDRDNAKTTVNIIKRFPRVVALKLQLGFTF